jgi:hypothetical protein
MTVDPLALVDVDRHPRRDARRAGALRHPGMGDVLAVSDEPFNAYWLPESMR